MALKQVTVSVPQELDDALQALSGLILAIKDGKSLNDIVALELPQAIKLMGEYQAIPAEVASQAGVSELALWASQLAGVLLGLK